MQVATASLREGGSRKRLKVAPCGLHIIHGPMSSGKTRELLRRLSRYRAQQITTVLLRKANTWRIGIDTKHHISSRGGNEGETFVEVDSLTNLNAKTLAQIDSAEVIAIDEGQFLQGLVPFCKHYVFNEPWNNNGNAVPSSKNFHPKLVIVAMLNGDYLQRPFRQHFCENTGELTSLMSDATYLTAVCHCCHEEGASYSVRVDVNGNVVRRKEMIEVIGSENYKSICCRCYIELK